MSVRMRCNNAAVIALVTSREFGKIRWVRETARQYAARLYTKDGDASGLIDLSPVEARDLLQPAIPRLIKTQKSSGLWRTKNAHEISFYLLKALAHARLLDGLTPQLRQDPFRPFRDCEDWYGIAVREQILKSPRPDEGAVKRRLLKAIAAHQRKDGSWEGTVMGTMHRLKILLQTGLVDTGAFSQGVCYLFSCLQPVLRHRIRNAKVAHDMFTSSDRKAEHLTAVKYYPQWIPHPECYRHLPVIQTGHALRLLNRSHYANDPRVLRACRNLFELHKRFGGWCVTNIRLGLQAEAKE